MAYGFGRFAKAVGSLAVVGLIATGCAGGADGSDGGGTLTLGSQIDNESFDPAQSHVGHYMPFFQAVYDTLIRQEPDGTLAPMLATDWSYNDDRTVLTMDLRTDVTFSDGAPFNAEAAKANLEHFQSANGRQASTLADVASVDVIDADTIALTLSAPNPSLELYLSQPAGFMGSPEALGTEAIATVPVGSGPYVMDEAASAPGVEYAFTARDDYWNPALQHYERVVFKVLSDDTARANALASGQVDAALIPRSLLPQVEAAGREAATTFIDWSGLLLLDRAGEIVPALGDVRVRQAINLALDRDAFGQAMYGGESESTSQVFGPAATAYAAELDDSYTFDLARARALMAEAGYDDGFSLAVPSLGQDMDASLALLGDQLAQIGVTLAIENVEFGDFVPGIGQGRWPVAMWRLFQGDTWTTANQLISERALYNPFGTTDPELAGLLDAVRSADEGDVAPARALNQYVLDNAWFAPMFRVPNSYCTNPAVVSVETQIAAVVPSLYNYTPAA